MGESAISNRLLEKNIEELLADFENRKKQRDLTCVPIGIQAYYAALENNNHELFLKTATALTHYFIEISSEFEKAVHYLKETIQYLHAKSDFEEESEFYRRLALNYDYQGELVAAKENYDASIKLLENRTDLTEKGFLTLARSLFNESIIYNRLGLVTLANDYLNKSSEYFFKANYIPGIIRCHISFGVQAYDEKNMEKALEHYQKALVLADDSGDIPPYCIASGNCAIVYAEIGERDKAISYIDPAIQKAKEYTNKHFEKAVYQMAGRVYQLIKEYSLADFWFATTDKLLGERSKNLDNSELYKYWAEVLSELGRHKEAYEKLSVFADRQNEIHTLNKEAELSDAMLRFKYEEGKKEHEMLRRKNSEIEEYAHRLEISNYELDQFAHVASHDMKEPLRMISNYTQLLGKSLHGKLSIDEQDYFYYINDGARRMMNVIQSLLQLSKINTTKKNENISLDKALNDVLQTLKPELEEKKVQVTYLPLPEIYADQTHMVQLFQNLISNSIKYNESANPIIEINYQSLDQQHYFEIADNGIGILPEYREKVFIIFQRLHNRSQYEGTGIGLAICKKIVDSLHGKIWIEDSTLGGSKFCFTLPK